MANYSIESFIEETNRAKSAADVSAIFGEALKQIGYDRFCYSLITPHPSLGLQAGHGIAKNYPDDWMSHYDANGYVKKDPVPRHCFATNRAFTWTDLVQSQKLKPEQLRLMDEAKEAKLLEGIAVPICGHSGELAGVGMASSVGGISPGKDLLYKIHALVQQFHLVYADFVRQDCAAAGNAGEQIHLTEREQEILLWAAAGKSDSSIAEIIKISRSTIRFHMNNIFKKLDANERTLATVKAIRLGLIVPYDVK